MGFLTGETVYLDKLEEMYYTFYDDVSEVPVAGIHFIQSLLLMENRTKEVVVLGDKDQFTGELQRAFLPDVTLLVSDDSEQLAEVAPFTSEYKQLDDQMTVYVCENFACHQPTTDRSEERRVGQE